MIFVFESDIKKNQYVILVFESDIARLLQQLLLLHKLKLQNNPRIQALKFLEIESAGRIHVRIFQDSPDLVLLRLGCGRQVPR